MISSSESSDERIMKGFQPTSLPETLAYELKNVSMLETPPPGTSHQGHRDLLGSQNGLIGSHGRKLETESNELNPNSFAILDSIEDEGVNRLMHSPIGRPSDKLSKHISRNLFGQRRDSTNSNSELLSVSNV
jgi:hypothetical protein